MEHLLCAKHHARFFAFRKLFLLLTTILWGKPYLHPHLQMEKLSNYVPKASQSQVMVELGLV